MQFTLLNGFIRCVMYVVVCTDLWGKELDRQVGVSRVVTSGKPMWCNGSTLAWNARDVGLSPALGTIFPIFVTPTTITERHGFTYLWRYTTVLVSSHRFRVLLAHFIWISRALSFIANVLRCFIIALWSSHRFRTTQRSRKVPALSKWQACGIGIHIYTYIFIHSYMSAISTII